MEAKMNYLDDWYNEILLFKWRRVLHAHPYLNQLDVLRDELKAFFPPNDFEAGEKINEHNWLLYLFFDKQPNSIYLINEVAELLRYYRQLGRPTSYHIFNQFDQIDYRALPERLFELHVHYMLSIVGLQPCLDQFYLTPDDVKKPMDMTIVIDDITYNVEVSKYYDGFKEALLTLATRIIGKVAADSAKGKYYLDEIFSGYLLFKKRSERLLRNGYAVFDKGLKQFIHGYRAAKNNTILLPAKQTTDDFEFLIEPGFADQYNRQYDTLSTGHPAFVKFRISANLKSNRSAIELNVTATESASDRNKRLLSKIHDKMHQHKSSPFPLLLVIAIEQTFTSQSKNRAIAIESKDVDEKALDRAIGQRAVLLLIFKNLKADGVSYQKMILGNPLHAALIEKLRLVDPVVYYKK